VGDMAEVFKGMKQHSKTKKQSNLEYSTKLIKDAGFDVQVKNGGVHLIVCWNNKVVDFWPSTGKWIVWGGKTSRGVKGLINFLNKG